MNDGSKIVEQIVKDYYDALDSGLPIVAFQPYFHWNDFMIINGDNVITSYEEYDHWYKGVQATMFERKHDIRSLEVTKEGVHYVVDMKIRFTCLNVDNALVEVNGDIKWLLSEDQTGALRISKYEIMV